MITKQNKGFTLIEILIVVAIIAILASVVLVGLGPTQQAGRDARRISDLSEVQNGLELYYNECGYYPGGAETTAPCGAFTQISTWTALETSLKGTPGISVSTVPNDPSGGAATYQYGTDSAGDKYVLAAKLENGGNSVFTGYTAPIITSITGVSSCASPYYCTTL